MVDRAILQMAKATPAYKDILRNYPKCHVYTDMNSYLWLSAAYHCEEILYVEPKSSFYFKFYWSKSSSIEAISKDIFNQTDFTVNVLGGDGPM